MGTIHPPTTDNRSNGSASKQKWMEMQQRCTLWDSCMLLESEMPLKQIREQ
jgi:hypothetical protein